MHAWEVLSPKMDTGFGYAEVKSVEEVQENGSLPDGAGFTLEETVGAMDKIFGLELVLYRGYNVLHTVGTCYYLNNVEYVKNSNLNLYCRCVLKCIQLVGQTVRAAEVSYEEDFIRIPLEFEMDFGKSASELVAELQDAEKELQEKVKDGDKFASGMKARFGLRRALLEMFDLIWEKPAFLPQLFKEKINTVNSVVAKMSESFTPLLCPDGLVEPNLVKRDLGMANPSKAVPDLTGDEIMAELKRLLQDLSLATLVPTSNPTFEDCFNFVAFFGMHEPCIFARAVLKRWISPKGDSKMLGTHPAFEVTESFFLQYKCPQSYLAHQLVKSQNFMVAEAASMQHMMWMMCLNPARQRRRIRDLLQHECPQLSQCALDLDRSVSSETDRRKFFRFFTAFQQLVNNMLALQHLKLGSLMKLYEVDELEQIYWYMGHLHKELDLWKEQLDQVSQKSADKKKNKGNKGKGPAVPKKVKILTHHDLFRGAEYGLCRGIYFTFLFLKAKGVYEAPVYELQPAKMRWHQRFSCMSDNRLVSPPVHYEKFLQKRTDDAKGNAAELLKHALDGFSKAKQKVDSAFKSRGDKVTEPETLYLKSLTKVAVINTLSLQALKPDAKKVTVDWSVNSFFPAIKITV